MLLIWFILIFLKLLLIFFQIKNHPLWRMVHIAILCNRTDIFSDEGIECIKKFGYSVDGKVF